jgi:hypothetical protein
MARPRSITLGTVVTDTTVGASRADDPEGFDSVEVSVGITVFASVEVEYVRRRRVIRVAGQAWNETSLADFLHRLGITRSDVEAALTGQPQLPEVDADEAVE